MYATVLAFYNPRKPLVAKILPQIREFCKKQKRVFFAFDSFHAKRDRGRIVSALRRSRGEPLALSLGGDGTLLTAARHIVDEGIALLGINLGGLGFLSAAEPATWREILGLAFGGKLPVKERQLFCVDVHAGNRNTNYLALNDCVIRSGVSPRMLELDLMRGTSERVARFRGDGLIIATPTGSTAYSLSAGGPIVEPPLPAFLIVPLASHSLTQRPLVLENSKHLIVTLASYHDQKTQAMVSLDGQMSHEIKTGDRVIVRPHRKTLKLLRAQDYEYCRLLREKLHWAV